MTEGTTPEPQRNRAARRAETRRLRKAGALMATIPAAFGTTALVVGATAGTAGAATLTVDNLGDSGPGTLRQALADANNGDTIVFDTGLTGTIALATELIVDASVTIQGPGADVIAVDGQDNVRIFNVSTEGGANGSFTVSGLTLTGGSASGGGAVLDANEDLTFTDVVFSENYSATDGGAIHSDAPDVDIVITRSTFSQNGAGGEGAALRTQHGASVTITDSTFSGNTAGGNGGALYIDESTGPVTITSSHFDHNAGSSGGAAAIWYSDIDLMIADSAFDQNYAVSGSGGSLYLYDLDSVTITGTQVTNSSSSSGGGGADIIYGTISVADSVFAGNTAGSDGGGLYVGYAEGPTTITNSTFAGNSAEGDGGGVVWYYNEGPLTLRNSTLSGNTADGWGGGLYIAYPNGDGGTAAVLNSTVSGNSAGTGGGIATASYYDISLVQTTITANTAPFAAGVFIPEAEDTALEAPKLPRRAVEAGQVSEPRAKAAGEYAVTASGTIIAENVGTDVEGGGTLTATGSLLGTIAGTTLVDGGANLSGASPRLGPLQDNGGPTRTHALLDGSPAVNAGPDPLTPFPGSDDDQRGPGYARVVGGRVDIGAFEVQTSDIEPTFTG